jgi:hypothetical protein
MIKREQNKDCTTLQRVRRISLRADNVTYVHKLSSLTKATLSKNVNSNKTVQQT